MLNYAQISAAGKTLAASVMTLAEKVENSGNHQSFNVLEELSRQISSEAVATERGHFEAMRDLQASAESALFAARNARYLVDRGALVGEDVLAACHDVRRDANAVLRAARC